MPDLNLNGKTIWITGASRGIGLATAKNLIDSGAYLILSASKESSLEQLRNENNSRNNISFIPFDMSNLTEVNEVLSNNSGLLGDVDILLNNAGIGIFDAFRETSNEVFDMMTTINYSSLFRCTKAVINGMIERKSGLIINTISVVATKVFLNSSVYTATKMAVLGMTRCLREEVRTDGVKVVNILPGATETEIWHEKVRNKHGDKMMKAQDVADVICNVIVLSQNNRLMVEEIVIRPQNGDL